MRNNITKLALLFGIIATMGFGTMNTAVADTSEKTGVALGHLSLVLADSDGNIKQYVQTDNLITHEGLDCLVESVFIGTASLCSTNLNPFDTIALGTGNFGTATAVTLTTPLATNCISADAVASANSGTATQRITVTVIFGGETSGATGVANAACKAAITEAGLFNIGDETNANNNLFAYQTFSAITIAAADTLTVTWDIDFS